MKKYKVWFTPSTDIGGHFQKKTFNGVRFEERNPVHGEFSCLREARNECKYIEAWIHSRHRFSTHIEVLDAN